MTPEAKQQAFIEKAMQDAAAHRAKVAERNEKLAARKAERAEKRAAKAAAKAAKRRT